MADCYLSGPVQKKLGRREFVDRTCLSVKATALTQEFSGTTYYVDPNAPEASDNGPGITPERPFATVQAAIGACGQHTGDVIAVMQTGGWQYDAGVYKPLYIQEKAVLNKAGVRLVGVTPGGMGVFWGSPEDGAVLITVTAMDCTIEGFIFDEGTATGCHGIMATYDGTNNFADNLEVCNCIFNDSVENGVWLDYVWYAHIHHNTFIDNAYGVYNAVDADQVSYARIHDNQFFRAYNAAIALLGDARYNWIYNNQFYNESAVQGHAAANEGINLTGGAWNMVCDNYFSCLLPVPANGDWNDFNTAGGLDAWVGNHCMNGLAVTNPT